MMTIRKMVMAQMASGATLMHGEFTPTEDIASYSINPGKEVSFIYVQCTSGVLISGVRNTAYLGAIVHNGELVNFGITSNAAGTNWTGGMFWSKSTSQSNNPITKSGTTFTFSPNAFASGSKFYASRTYEWYAV